jgi:glucokinase
MNGNAGKIAVDEPVALGFDIGGSMTKLGIISRSGAILAIDKTPTDVEEVGLAIFLQKFFFSMQRLLERVDGKVCGIGGAFLGWIDEERTGPFLCFNAPQLHGVNLRKMIEDRFNLPVRLIDDTNAHALAEYTYGCGRGRRRFMNLAMGTGLSAGVIIHGEALQFTGGCAGDTGHVILRPGGPVCSAGCKGCAEALIGVEGIERVALAKYGRPKSARQVIELARKGQDPVALEVIAEIGGYTGELLASLSHIFLPERISLSGGTATAGGALLSAVRDRFETLNGDYHRAYSRLSNGYYQGVDIVLSELKGETGLIGSVAHFFAQGPTPVE